MSYALPPGSVIYKFPPGSVYKRYEVNKQVFTNRKDDKPAVIYEFMQVLFAAANAHQDNDDVRELRYIARQILGQEFSDPRIQPRDIIPRIQPWDIITRLNNWAKAAKTEQITGFLVQYMSLLPPKTLEELGYGPSFISSSSDADKKRILAEQTPYADFIHDRSRAFNDPSRPRPPPREPELPPHMLSDDGGGRRRRRKTKKSKRRSRKTRRRHK